MLKISESQETQQVEALQARVRQLEEELRRSRERYRALLSATPGLGSGPHRALLERLAATGRMAARIAHEINNPLAGIRNSFLLIKDAVPQDHPYHEYVGRIEREIERIARIVGQMYDLHRPRPEPAQKLLVEEVIRDVVALLDPLCQQQGVRITVVVPAGPMAVVLPEGSLRQVLLNLVQNAIEASPAGCCVTVEARASESQLIVCVQDEGVGIPAEIAPQIFEPFFTTKSGFSRAGLGLGLGTSRSLVEAMRGQLDFQSKAGKGTIFRLVVPTDATPQEGKDG